MYIQAAYLIPDDKTLDRKFGAFEAISDNYPKYVISMDSVDMSRDGIIHRNLADRLLE